MELLEKDNLFSIHHQNIKPSALKIYKVHYDLSKNSFYDIFENSRSSYNLRSQHNLLTPLLLVMNNNNNKIIIIIIIIIITQLPM